MGRILEEKGTMSSERIYSTLGGWPGWWVFSAFEAALVLLIDDRQLL